MAVEVGGGGLGSIYVGDKLVAGGGSAVAPNKGMLPEGYHIPTIQEWKNLISKGVSLGAWTTDVGLDKPIPCSTYLKMPKAGVLDNYDGTNDGSEFGRYWSCTYQGSQSAYEFTLQSSVSTNYTIVTYGHPIRGFKDKPVIPTNTQDRITLYAGNSSNKGIFHNPILGIISISANGSDWQTIADKNMGASKIYEYGDTMAQDNCGYLFQRGNCYGFPYTGATTKTTNQVNASSYGPGNYYYSSTFCNRGWRHSDKRRDSSGNTNLWGGDDA